MASPNDLVTLAQAKAWLKLPDVTTDDGTLGLLISQMSRLILGQINRAAVLPKSFNYTANGNGGKAMMVREYPVLGITSLTIDGCTIPAAVGNGSGYILESCDDEPPGAPQSIYLRGYAFNRGTQNITVIYTMGYRIAAEPMVAAVAAVAAQQPFGAWGSDMGVKYASTGAALSKVITAPAAGQYMIDVKVQGGYVFNAADAGTAMLVSYGYIPFDLAQACLEWLAERWAYKGRVGMASKSLGGQETTSFALKIPDFVIAGLSNYTRVATF